MRLNSENNENSKYKIIAVSLLSLLSIHISIASAKSLGFSGIFPLIICIIIQ